MGPWAPSVYSPQCKARCLPDLKGYVFLRNSFVVAGMRLCFITQSLLELILVWTVYLVNCSVVAFCVKMWASSETVILHSIGRG